MGNNEADAVWQWENSRLVYASWSEAQCRENFWVCIQGSAHSSPIYTDRQVADFAKMLAPCRLPPAAIAMEMTLYATMVALALRTEPRITIVERRKAIRKKFIEPIAQILSYLDDNETSREFLVAYSSLRSVSTAEIRSILDKTLARAQRHDHTLASFTASGRRWDSAIKLSAVEWASELCEYINHDFEPKRTVQEGHSRALIADAVHLLCKPLNLQHLEGYVRQHVDDWNSAKRVLVKTIEKKADFDR